MLIVFDIDGTLTRTEGTDELLFVRALSEVHGFTLETAEWQSCRYVSDRGIAEEVLERRLGRPPVDGDVHGVRDRFLALLEASLPSGEALQVPGAAALLAHLRAAGHGVALATGCWRASALLKLARAGLDVAGLPIATCDDHPAREEILRLAIARAGTAGRVVYVGDGRWDAATTRLLGLPFVGVDHAGTGRLAGQGVGRVLRDFTDAAAFLDAAATARPPEPMAP